MMWQSIETAPKDGAWVLLWMVKPVRGGYAPDGPHAVIGQWEHPRPGHDDRDGAWNIPFEDEWHRDDAFTHWHPLPAPPA